MITQRGSAPEREITVYSHCRPYLLGGVAKSRYADFVLFPPVFHSERLDGNRKIR